MMNKAKIVKDFTSMFPVNSFIRCEEWRLVYCQVSRPSPIRTLFYFFDEDAAIQQRVYSIHGKKFNVTCRPEIEERFRAVIWRVFQIQNHNKQELITLLKLIAGPRWHDVYEMIGLAKIAYIGEHDEIGTLDDPILRGEDNEQ